MKVFKFSDSRTLGRLDSYLADGFTLVGVFFYSVRSLGDVPPEGSVTFSYDPVDGYVVELVTTDSSSVFSRTYCVFRLVKPSDLPF